MFTGIENTTMVQVMQSQDNPTELFKKWNTKNHKKVKCSRIDCSNISNNEVYIVTKLNFLNDKFIIPLCQECYKLAQNNNYTDSEIYNYGLVTKVTAEVLFKYEEEM